MADWSSIITESYTYIFSKIKDNVILTHASTVTVLDVDLASTEYRDIASGVTPTYPDVTVTSLSLIRLVSSLFGSPRLGRYPCVQTSLVATSFIDALPSLEDRSRRFVVMSNGQDNAAPSQQLALQLASMLGRDRIVNNEQLTSIMGQVTQARRLLDSIEQEAQNRHSQYQSMVQQLQARVNQGAEAE